MDQPAVSVVIATHNGARRIGIQLAALASQVGAPQFEVVVVDNASSDETAAVAAAWADELPVRVVPANAHRGTSYARNVGIAEARAAIVAFCDDDDCVGETWVAAAEASLAEASLVTGAVTDLPAEVFTDVGRVRSKVREPEVFVPPHPEPGFDSYPVLMGGNSAIRRELALGLRGFDQRFFPGAEDNDLALRHLAGGGRLLRAPSMVVAARTRPTTTGAARRAFEGGRMHMRLCQVHSLWDVSDSLSDPDFRLDLLRALGAWGVALFRRDGDRHGTTTRVALRAGQVLGWLESGVLRRVPPPQLGLGLPSEPPE